MQQYYYLYCLHHLHPYPLESYLKLLIRGYDYLFIKYTFHEYSEDFVRNELRNIFLHLISTIVAKHLLLEHNDF